MCLHRSSAPGRLPGCFLLPSESLLAKLLQKPVLSLAGSLELTSDVNTCLVRNPCYSIKAVALCNNETSTSPEKVAYIIRG